MRALEFRKRDEVVLRDLGDYFSLVEALLCAEVKSVRVDLDELEGESCVWVFLVEEMQVVV